MEAYDPLIAPDPEQWLMLDELERTLLVEEYHEEAEIELPEQQLHATIHVVIENQLASDQLPEVQNALDRLSEEGLDRHDALHAIGSVLIQHIHNLLQKPATNQDPNKAYVRDLASLTAKKWLAS